MNNDLTMLYNVNWIDGWDRWTQEYMSWDNGTAFQLVLGQKQDESEYHIDSNGTSSKQTPSLRQYQ